MSATSWTRLFRDYPGEWVALKDNETTVIAHGTDLSAVQDEAAARGFTAPLVFKVPATDDSGATGP